jgi:hypothetical protein
MWCGQSLLVGCPVSRHRVARRPQQATAERRAVASCQPKQSASLGWQVADRHSAGATGCCDDSKTQGPKLSPALRVCHNNLPAREATADHYLRSLAKIPASIFGVSARGNGSRNSRSKIAGAAIWQHRLERDEMVTWVNDNIARSSDLQGEGSISLKWRRHAGVGCGKQEWSTKCGRFGRPRERPAVRRSSPSSPASVPEFREGALGLALI